MGKPAARLGDPTAHGGVIVVGFPMVLIGGMPAARLGDMHVCPMLNPGVPPPPHVGGPIILGSTMVFIGGQPAARMGDMVMCAGPPDSIIFGCPTVLIGEGGSGSASGGGASAGVSADIASLIGKVLSSTVDQAKMAVTAIVESARDKTNEVIDTLISAVESAVSSAATAFSDNTESSTKEGHWLEFEFSDTAGTPLSGVNYELVQPDQKKSIGSIASNGIIRRDAQQPGQGTVKLVNLFNPKWSKEIAKVGEKVKLSIQADGYDEGTPAAITIFRKDISGAERTVMNLESAVKSKKIELEIENKFESPDEENNSDINKPLAGYYFECRVEQSKAVSDLLYIEDFIELELKNSQGPVANAEYVLFLPNGKVESGKLDSNGYKKIEKIPAGKYSVRFPGLIKQNNA